MDNDVIKKEDFQIQEKESFPLQEQNDDIANIISNEDMKDLMRNLLGEFDSSREESLDMYYVFKNMITNSGDFDSSPVVKEQASALLRNAQDASNAKMRIFDTLIKSKMKQQITEHAEIKQNNIFMNTDRRTLLKELERMKNEEGAFTETISQIDKIEEKLDSIQQEDKKEENIHSKGINNDEEVDFEIKTGDFE